MSCEVKCGFYFIKYIKILKDSSVMMYEAYKIRLIFKYYIFFVQKSIILKTASYTSRPLLNSIRYINYTFPLTPLIVNYVFTKVSHHLCIYYVFSAFSS